MKKILTGRDELVGPWVCKRTGGEWWPGMGTAIGLEQDGKLIAGVLYDNYNGANIQMHVAGEGRRWLNRDYLRFCFHYPFNQLKVKRITGIVPSVNDDALKFDTHIGFRYETTLRDAHPDGDLIVLVMRREDCRWIGDDHGKQIERA